MLKNQDFVNYLTELFPEGYCELKFNSTFELLVAVILSAQCTDKRVNAVTEKLFKTYNTPQQFAQMPIEQLEELIKPCGFYHNKAKHIVQASESILNNFNGQVPSEHSQLLTLAGVGRKTANVVSSVAFGANVVAVDTHVLRVSNRLGFANTQNPNVCEKALTKKFKHDLANLHYRMVLFGRYYCKARNPLCEECKLKQNCKYYSKKAK